MSNARDKANIPALNFSSTGIDDNATSTAITINSSEQVAFTDGTASLPSITNLGDENTGMFFPSANQIGFATNGAETVRINANGAMALGTTTINDKLHVFNSATGSNTGTAIRLGQGYNSAHTRITSNFGGSVSLDAGIGASQPEIRFKTNNITRQKLASNGDISFYEDTGTTPKFFWDASNEKLGIGQSNPTMGQINLATTGNFTTAFTDPTGTCISMYSTGTAGDGNYGAGIAWGALGGVNSHQAAISSVQTGSDANQVGLAFFTHNSTVGSDPIIERMRIDSSGNVGIGTSSPNSNLHISSGVSTSLQLERTASGTEGKLILSSATSFNAIFSRDGSDSDKDFAIYTGSNERMRITSSGKVGIGETSMDALLVIKGDSDESTTPSIRLKDGSDSREAWITNTAGDLILTTGGNDNVPHTQLRMLNGNLMTFKTSNTERMRIDSSGFVLVGKTSDNFENTGCILSPSGYGSFVNPNNIPVYVNRQTTDGILVSLRHADTQEGSISVSGTTVSYNGFTGTHWSRFTDNSKPTILKGTVLESLDEMCDWYNLEFDVITQDEDGNDITSPQKVPHVLTDTQSDGDVITYNHEGTDYQATIVKEADIKHMKSKVSDTVDAKNVYGVFVAYDEDGEGYNDFYVASVGSFVVRIKQGETVAKGDLLQSNGDGTAKVQTDDAVRSSSFAKVLSTTIIETYEDGSYLVPCSLMC
jgi:hypothetical protein